MKRKKNVLIISILGILFLLAGVLVLSLGGKWGESLTLAFGGQEEITVGVVYNTALDNETNFIQGVYLALDEINASGGVLGKRLQIQIKNDENNPTIALQKAHTFKEEGITAVIGHWSTNVSYVTEEIYEENQIVMISPSATGMSLLEEDYRYIFRMIANNEVFSKTLAEYIRDSGAGTYDRAESLPHMRSAENVAISYSDDTYGRNFANILEQELAACGITVVDRISNLSEANAGSVSERLTALNCEGIILAKTPPEIKEDIRIIRTFEKDYELFAAENLARSSYRDGLDGVTTGIHVATYATAELDQEFLTAFFAACTEQPDIYAIAGYDALHLLAQAMEAAGSAEGPAISEYIRTLEYYDGACGRLEFNGETGEFEGYQITVETIGKAEENNDVLDEAAEESSSGEQAETAAASEPPVPVDIKRILEKGYLEFGFAADDRPPFYMTDENGTFYGLDVELAESIANELGVEAVFNRESKTYQELFEKVTNGEVDIVAAKFSRTLKRAISVRYTGAYAQFRRALMLGKTQETKLGISGNPIPYLKQQGIRVAVIRSTSFVEYAKEMFPDAEIVEYESVQTATEALLKDEVTAFLYDELEFARYMAAEQDLLLYTSVYVLEDMKEYICAAVSPENVNLKEWLDVYLQNRNVDWTLSGIMEAYPEIFSATSK